MLPAASQTLTSPAGHSDHREKGSLPLDSNFPSQIYPRAAISSPPHCKVSPSPRPKDRGAKDRAAGIWPRLRPQWEQGEPRAWV